jgi:uncharacterized protein YodC (DUF2158 family)
MKNKTANKEKKGSKFANGDVVFLNSGGPNMVIETIEEYAVEKYLYRCRWYDDERLEFKADKFREETITLATPSAL